MTTKFRINTEGNHPTVPRHLNQPSVPRHLKRQASRLSKLLVCAAWIFGLVAALLWLSRIGGFSAASPPLGSSRELRNWFAQRDPLDIAASAARLIAMILLGYLLIVSSLQVVALRNHNHRRNTLATRLAPRFLLFFTAGLMASTSTAFAGTASYTAEPDRPATPTAPAMEVLQWQDHSLDLAPINATQARTSLPWASNPPQTSAAVSDLESAPEISPTTARPQPPAPPTAVQADPAVVQAGGSSDTPKSSKTAQTPTMSTTQASPTTGNPSQHRDKRAPGLPPAPSTAPSAAIPPERLTTSPSGQPATEPSTQPTTEPSAQPMVHYTVVSGDNIWTISEQVLIMRTGSQPCAAQIAQYSSKLIELNRSVLILQDNPSLILAGQQFQLPLA